MDANVQTWVAQRDADVEARTHDAEVGTELDADRAVDQGRQVLATFQASTERYEVTNYIFQEMNKELQI